jgi:hypothetical protein
MISLFCFRHLIPHCRTGTVLCETAQIGIEVAVPQRSMDFLKNARCKKDVCKDVVIWAEPKMTVWGSDFKFKPCREPLSVMLWKVINQATASLSKLSNRPST